MKKYQEILLIKTCVACPEQHDAFYGIKKVGYLRLRHGFFRAEHNGKIVYQANPIGDGCFEDHERQKYLKKSKKAIYKSMMKNK